VARDTAPLVTAADLAGKAIPVALAAQLVELYQDEGTRKRSEDFLTTQMGYAMGRKFESRGFGKWKKLSPSTMKRKAGYTKNKPLIETRQLVHFIKKNWRVEEFKFGALFSDTGKLIEHPDEEIKKNMRVSLDNLSFWTRFHGNSAYKSLPYKRTTQLGNFKELISVHTAGSTKVRLPARPVLLTEQEFMREVWSRFLKKFPELLKGKLKQLRPTHKLTRLKLNELFKYLDKTGLFKEYYTAIAEALQMKVEKEKIPYPTIAVDEIKESVDSMLKMGAYDDLQKMKKDEVVEWLKTYVQQTDKVKQKQISAEPTDQLWEVKEKKGAKGEE